MSHLPDVNVWLALSISSHPHHGVAVDWLSGVRHRRDVHFCRATQRSLLRLLTSRAVFAGHGLEPMSNDRAWSALDELLADDRVTLDVAEPATLDRRWRQYASRSTSSPKLWMDAYLAAFARGAGHRMVTTDQAFRQFDGLDLLVLGGDGPAS